ncbi:hypothetical protein ACN38_g9069 [Penicillium nordicum]|uniref:Uncharacterized protein n=1 Tax=Penicillium nordicum TaxID=229535 RepID=A0A0M9WD74_9EURO|nr:hypothetical protein ACN38_g9069 [Penicillium nordicum]
MEHFRVLFFRCPFFFTPHYPRSCQVLSSSLQTYGAQPRVFRTAEFFRLAGPRGGYIYIPLFIEWTWDTQTNHRAYLC